MTSWSRRERARAALQEENFRFHFLFYECADGLQTVDFVRALRAKYPLDLLSQMPGRPMRVSEEHPQLLESPEKGDSRGAMAAMEAHIRTGCSEFRANYQTPAGIRKPSERRHLSRSAVIVNFRAGAQFRLGREREKLGIEHN